MLQIIGDIRGLTGLDFNSIDSQLEWLTKLASALNGSIGSIRESVITRYEIQITVGTLNYLNLLIEGEEVAIFRAGVGLRDKGSPCFIVNALDSWVPKILEVSEELAGKIDGRFFEASKHFASLQLQLHLLNEEGTTVVSLNRATGNLLARNVDLSIDFGERIYLTEVDPESIKTMYGQCFIDAAEVESISGTSYKVEVDKPA